MFKFLLNPSSLHVSFYCSGGTSISLTYADDAFTRMITRMMLIDDNEADDDITFSLCFCIPTIDDYDDDITFSLCSCIPNMHHSMVSSADQLATPPDIASWSS